MVGGFGCGFFIVAGGADPGRGAERLSERHFGMGPDAKKRFRTRRRGRQRSRAKCGNRGRRTRPAGSKLPCRALIRLRRLATLKGHRPGNRIPENRCVLKGHPILKYRILITR